jgi:CRISPR-associated endonuclease/helicase Cas3
VISFAEFLQAVHRDAGLTPYPWQARFAERCREGAPPELVGVPTGCGKTTVVDALVWALACQADLPPAERSVGARIVWAIDRRILVDEVHARAAQLAERLLQAAANGHDPLHETATRLAALSGDVPLIATRWRGGISDRRPLHAPTQPEVITSTVAQVGSRMLFRGYGVGRRSLAVEAGLATCDVTLCLDEAHLAEPFRQTLDAIRARRAETERNLSLPALGSITLTATPSRPNSTAIMLDDADRHEPRLRRRLEAQKLARLEDEPPTERDRVKLIAGRAMSYLEDGAPTVACVVNTVRRAREVFDLLDRELSPDQADVALLVGPQRPADRERLLADHGPLLFAGSPSTRPLVCVATQTFEVGLDADVASMVTDSASTSALVQRLGRLNRRGHGSGEATIVRDAGSWLYGDEEERAWKWLEGRAADGRVDVSVAALEADRTRPAPAHVRSAPSLTSAVMDLLVQTSPPPGPWQEPSVEGFLRGAEEPASADVTVCWRSDVLPHLDEAGAEGYREMLLKLVPPQQREQLPLSIPAARALIAARYPGDARPTRAATAAAADADVEGVSPDGRVPEAGSGGLPVPFLVIRSDEVLHGTLSGEEGKVGASSLKPGDVLVLPAEAGGVDRYGLAPGAGPDPAAGDVAGDRIQEPVDGRDAPLDPIRISPAALGEQGAKNWPQIRARCRAVDDGTLRDRSQRVSQLVEELSKLLPDHAALLLLASSASTPDGEPIRLLLRSVGATQDDDMPALDEAEVEAIEGSDSQPEEAEGLEPQRLERTWVLVPIRERDRERRRRDTDDPPPTLERHARAVGDRVESFVAEGWLPRSVKATLALAAAAHDHGKADPRTQAFFHGGVSPLGAEPIAKSVFGTDDPRTEKLARAVAGAPRGLRHEIASAAVASEWLAGHRRDEADLDADLLLHLIGSHHGHGRPIPPLPTEHAEAAPFHVAAAGVQGTARGDGQDGWADGQWLQRFWRVVDRYGEWGTAYLEALLVLADRTVSAEGG